jgi:hypothetical protein
MVMAMKGVGVRVVWWWRFVDSVSIADIGTSLIQVCWFVEGGGSTGYIE